jgi:sugar/nucleoside kinase (ribokinase family)
MKENDIQNAIHFANRCAALSVTRVGTQVSFPSLKEIEEIL